MSFAEWSVFIGMLLIIMALSSTLLKRLPISSSMLYLAVGVGIGPLGWSLMRPDPVVHSVALEILTEIAVLISLFAAGMKLGIPLSNKVWYMPLRLAFISMTLTVAMIVVIGVYGLGMSLGLAVLLGAILAPTDPVLASDVQVEDAEDRDRLRFSLTGEGGLNDGAAFPFVMLGLGLLGLHDLGQWGWRWLMIDVVWAILAGLFIGALLGTQIGRLVIYLRSRHEESIVLDEFLVLGLIALTYGIAVLCQTYGFLAVFAAGLALQRVRQQDGGKREASKPAVVLPDPKDGEEIVADPELVGERMMQALQGFNEQLERIGEVAVVLVVGAMLAYSSISFSMVWFVILLFVVVRPVSVWLGLLGAPISRDQRKMIAWFGIRGIGSIYYLMYSINHGLPAPQVTQVIALTLATVTVSIIVHGISVTPMMAVYARRKARRRGGQKKV